MKVFLSRQCESLTGSLGSGFGYCIESRRKKNGELYHYSRRNAKGLVPPDGHWRFIKTCANLAQNKLHITDIQIHWSELSDALYKAGHSDAFRHVTNNGLADVKINYNARDIINLQITFGL